MKIDYTSVLGLPKGYQLKSLPVQGEPPEAIKDAIKDAMSKGLGVCHLQVEKNHIVCDAVKIRTTDNED